VVRFAPREPAAAAAGVRELAVRVRTQAGSAGRETDGAFARDGLATASALAQLDPERDTLVAFVGKLIVSKGVDLLLACWPLVLERVPSARLVVVGFGAYRDGLERLRAALAAGDLEQARKIALAGRTLEADVGDGEAQGDADDGDADDGTAAGGTVSPPPLRHLLSFLQQLRGAALERYLAAARALDERVIFTGRLEHDELAELLPACEAVVVPSTFPEAFGMVAVEAAACGALPVSAAHSGLAEVSGVLAGAIPARAAEWLSFTVDDRAVESLAARVTGWLQADPALRERTRDALVATARDRWSWEGVARGVIAAAQGDLDTLAQP
jgi:glycosyltransferase involved in cell wall biosynthesis